MKVTLRQRNQGGKTSLYLDYYDRGKRKSEYLKMYLEPKPRNAQEREQNRKTLALAQAIAAKKQVQIQNQEYEFQDTELLNSSFLEFVELLKIQRHSSKGNYGSWDSMLKHLKLFAGQNDISFKNVNERLVKDFKHYLDKVARTKNNKPLSPSTKYAYFNKFRAAVKQAVRERILTINPCEAVSSFPEHEAQREYLTLEEVRSLKNTPCERETMKKAFLFACYTGLRFGDIADLVWSEITHSNEMGYCIRFIQNKRGRPEDLPISDEAYSFLGDRGANDDLVFEGLRYSHWESKAIQKWLSAAGIKKHITFHCSRHTNGTLLLTLGEDIYTVSKMLGHKNLKATQIYARIIDSKKKQAANRIKQ